ncbi:hypothetical protein KAU33_16010 [Candidatus Dependentiae bacterium]|nr:hypothetical protein [Candidatus Dependentiae bacterium]
MNKDELKKELFKYELNLPYPFSCFPEPERKKFAFLFMMTGRAINTRNHPHS